MSRLADKDYLKINGRLAKGLNTEPNIIGYLRSRYFSGVKLPAIAEALEVKIPRAEEGKSPRLEEYKKIYDFIQNLGPNEIITLFTPNQEVLDWGKE